jgi:ribosome-associated protein
MISIPYSEFTFTFSRSSGAGGQNVNKVNTRATLVWDITKSISISEAIKKRFSLKYKRYLIESVVMISSQKTRSQSQNIDDCISKLNECLSEVEFPPKNRRPTKPTRGSVKRRLDTKTKHSKLKKQRREKF